MNFNYHPFLPISQLASSTRVINSRHPNHYRDKFHVSVIPVPLHALEVLEEGLVEAYVPPTPALLGSALRLEPHHARPILHRHGVLVLARDQGRPRRECAARMVAAKHGPVYPRPARRAAEEPEPLGRMHLAEDAVGYLRGVYCRVVDRDEARVSACYVVLDGVGGRHGLEDRGERSSAVLPGCLP